MLTLPTQFTDQMRMILEDEFPAFLESYEEPRKYALRVNTLKITPEQFEDLAPFHLTKVPWLEGAYYYEEKDAVSRHPFYYAGLYYLQEPAAMTPAGVLGAAPGERVLDLCAAPGGKATALGAALQGQGLLVANDISATRVRALLKNIEVFGITNSLVTNTTPAKLAEHFPEYFDKVLVDAPCSGEAMFRKEEKVLRAWTPDKPAQCAKIQKEIVLRAADMLRPGGRMLYSTCSFAPEEDEEIIAYLLRERPQMHLKPIPMQEGFAPGLSREKLMGISGMPGMTGKTVAAGAGKGTAESERGLERLSGAADETACLEDLTRCVRLWPHRIGGEGHFLALLEKDETDSRRAEIRITRLPGDAKAGHRLNRKQWRGEDISERTSKGIKNRSHLSRKDKDRGMSAASARMDRSSREKLSRFCADTDIHLDLDQVEVRQNQVFLPAIQALEAAGIPFARNGVYLGEMKKDRFEPAQSFAMALNLGGTACPVQNLFQNADSPAMISLAQTDERILSYLKGESIPDGNAQTPAGSRHALQKEGGPAADEPEAVRLEADRPEQTVQPAVADPEAARLEADRPEQTVRPTADEPEGSVRRSAGEPEKAGSSMAETGRNARSAEKGNGWVVVRTEGFALGWGKRTGGLIKNKYQPGWRIRET